MFWVLINERLRVDYSLSACGFLPQQFIHVETHRTDQWNKQQRPRQTWEQSYTSAVEMLSKCGARHTQRGQRLGRHGATPPVTDVSPSTSRLADLAQTPRSLRTQNKMQSDLIESGWKHTECKNWNPVWSRKVWKWNVWYASVLNEGPSGKPCRVLDRLLLTDIFPLQTVFSNFYLNC